LPPATTDEPEMFVTLNIVIGRTLPYDPLVDKKFQPTSWLGEKDQFAPLLGLHEHFQD
jgi:hypothetical protein